MRDIIERLYNIARARIGSPDRPGNEFDTGQYDWEEDTSTSTGNSKTTHESTDQNRSPIEIPRQVIDDLTLFALTPPSSLQEVRQARNRELQKYHSDKFIKDDEKFQTSKEIMQIYNAAYERLEKYFSKK